MNRLPFTKYASKALNEGREIAGYLGFKDVSSIFVLLGLYGADGSLASEVLKMHGVTRELIEEAIRSSSLPNKAFANVFDSSVLPTPVGPKNKNDPIGRFGLLRPTLLLFTALATALTASSCPITCL